jgi:CheY-like chemotaxis protein
MSPKVVELHALMRQAEEITRNDSLAHGVSVVLRLEAARDTVIGDSVRLQQVFWNLLRNAIKFTLEGGTVTVSTHNDSDGRILAMVEDTGIGISAEALPGVFNLFEQGKLAGQRYGGLGLGLAISHTIICAHGGTIGAESAGEGLGARFTVTLDTVDAPLPDAAGEGAVARPKRSLRLLIVEDHPATRDVLLRLLTRNGHQVTTASSVQNGLAAFHSDVFDVVISDLGLPDGSGLELMREIRAISPVPAIALSGYGMDEDQQRTKDVGFSAHLVKPVDLDQLQKLLSEIVGAE